LGLLSYAFGSEIAGLQSAEPEKDEVEISRHAKDFIILYKWFSHKSLGI
jgi:hypothetical protein